MSTPGTQRVQVRYVCAASEPPSDTACQRRGHRFVRTPVLGGVVSLQDASKFAAVTANVIFLAAVTYAGGLRGHNFR